MELGEVVGVVSPAWCRLSLTPRLSGPGKRSAPSIFMRRMLIQTVIPALGPVYQSLWTVYNDSVIWWGFRYIGRRSHFLRLFWFRLRLPDSRKACKNLSVHYSHAADSLQSFFDPPPSPFFFFSFYALNSCSSKYICYCVAYAPQPQAYHELVLDVFKFLLYYKL